MLHATVGRCQLVSAIALLKRDHGLWIRVGQDGLCFAQGGRHTGDPLHLRLGQFLKVGLTVEGTIGHQIGQAVSRLQLLHMESHRLAKRLGITAVATEWLHQEGDSRLVLHHQL